MEKRPPFNNLPVYIKWNIIENFMHVTNQDTSINRHVDGAPDIFDKTQNANESFTDDAHALACLARLDKKSAQLAKRMEECYPSAHLGASRERILKMRNMWDITFSKNFSSLISNNGNVSVPLDELSENKVRICLNQLSEIGGNRLKNLKLTINKHYVYTNSTMPSTLWMKAIRKIRENNPATVIELDLGLWNPKSDDEGEEFASILRLCKVKELDFRYAYIKSDTIVAISESLGSAGVRALNLSAAGISIDNQAAFSLAKGLHNSKLEYLNLSLAMIDPEGLLKIIKALPHSNLMKLDIKGNAINIKVMKTLAAILPMTGLIQLQLSHYRDRLEAEGVKAMMDAVPKSQLTALVLDNIKINEDTLQSIVRAIQNSKLSDLAIHSVNLGDAGAIAIANALSQSSITRLQLWDSNIGDEGVKAFEAVIVDSKLNCLELENNENISQAGIEGLIQTVYSLKLEGRFIKIDINSF